MTSRRHLRLRSNRVRTSIAATLGSCLTCVVLLSGMLQALDPNKRLTQYMHVSWRIQDGSVPSGMFSVTQTSDGFVWFTSLSRSMYRFDGVRFVPWTLSVDGKPIDRVVSVYGDHAGGLWVLGLNEIVHLKNGIVTSHFELTGQQRTENISEDPDGSLWVAEAGTYMDKPLCHVTDSAIKCLGESDGVGVPSAESVLADGKGGFWLGGQRALAHWHDGVSEVYPIEALKSNTSDGIAGLALGPDGSLWVGMLREGPGAGLGRLEGEVFKSFVMPGFDGSRLAVSTLTFDHDGSLWVGTLGKGLFRIHEDTVEHYGRAEGLSGDSVWAIFEDREGILWVTTTNGIDSFRAPPVTTFSAVEGLKQDAAVGVLARRDGAIWVANGDSLDHIEKNGTISSIRWGSGLPGDQVTTMLEDHAGNLWIAVGDGLYLLQNGQFHRVPEPNHQPLGMILTLIEDVDGNIWAGCYGKQRKLVRIRDFQVREQFLAPQFPLGRLAPDPHGGIWIGTRKRILVLFRNGALQNFPINSNAKPNADLPTWDIRILADGSVLAAFDEGIVGLREGRTQWMTTRNGLPCNTVYSFIRDKEKSWWLYTSCGIVELPDSELQRWWANSEAVLKPRLYGALDGARPNWYSITPAALSPDGRVWFATGQVVQMVDPSRLPQAAPPAPTYIESVKADRKEFAATNDLRVPPRPRDLQIDYTSPTFLIPQQVTFRYRLEGYDRDWHQAGTRRQAFYADLPPGKYSFRVMASNSDGVWNDKPTKLDFSVTPAYYQTAWFRAVCVVFLLSLLWAVYHWRVRQLRHDFELTLDARVGERTRIARDLHDTLLQSFHGLLLRLQTVSQLLRERPAEAQEKLDSTIEQAAAAITEGRDAVQGLRDSTLQANDLARAISTLGEELTSDPTDRRPTFRVAVEGQSRDLHPIVRDEIYKIAAEALRNAFLHSKAKQVEVEVRYDDDRLRLRVRDDGKGMSSEILSGQTKQGHYGLPGMRERANLIGGKLTIWSEVDAGTEVELRVPASLAYKAIGRGSWLSRNFAAKAKA